VEQSSSTISRRSSRWSPSPPTHATTSDESWCQISRREVIKLAIHATLQLPPTVHRLSDRARICRPKDVALRHSAISVGYTRIRVGDSNFQFRHCDAVTRSILESLPRLRCTSIIVAPVAEDLVLARVA
jgi:hypothetical protein